ncbi:Acyl-CoA:1-acyl-sn-glycerol-3-phosphate acyltransferase [hydrothermal vent metagenome]|uniref:Acyl-CoA:1-acyl-sn-glycerol-3-phosphate acyltransferase n=1 Tax=hydrothermal vent metagenome TaxID=652676 RepID=A0A3B0S386_9ZZZZ
MSYTWDPGAGDAPVSISFTGWIRVVIGGIILAVILGIGVVLTLVFRLIERPIFGLHRPITPYFTQWVARGLFFVMGIKNTCEGAVMKTPGAIVSNHSTWLDIFALYGHMRVYFLAKADVATWPGIGFLTDLAGTLFVARDRKMVKIQTKMIEDRLLARQRLAFFPEGTSTDGMRVLRFNSTLFQSFFNPDLVHEMYIQPVSMIYTAPKGQDKRFYGWWGDMDFGPNFLKILATRQKGSVRIVYHPAIRVDGFKNRKQLAAHVEAIVRQGMPAERRIS